MTKLLTGSHSPERAQRREPVFNRKRAIIGFALIFGWLAATVGLTFAAGFAGYFVAVLPVGIAPLAVHANASRGVKPRVDVVLFTVLLLAVLVWLFGYWAATYGTEDMLYLLACIAGFMILYSLDVIADILFLMPLRTSSPSEPVVLIQEVPRQQLTAADPLHHVDLIEPASAQIGVARHRQIGDR